VYVMSVDLESWLHRPVFGIPPEKQTKLEEGGFMPRAVELLLEKLDRFKAKATFFCLGSVAEWYPESIKAIAAQGHELAVHGYSHRPLHEHTRASFEDEVRRTATILNQCGEQPVGFRAPTFSRSPFLYEVLESNGFRYDSSILPVRTPLYDWSMFGSCEPFWATAGILEIPLSMHKIPLLGRVPVGGVYLRLLGGSVNTLLLKRIERTYGVAVFYVHPWELLPNPHVGLPLAKRPVAYYRIPASRAFERVLSSFAWTSFRDSLDVLTERLAGATPRDER
jgi:polysaccharide deacetylase family protein (PEP-CTERM system associated)